MKRLNFITNIAPGDNGGGMSAVSYSTHAQLQRFFEVNYIGPIQAPADKWEHRWSKLARVLKLKGKYFFFSDKRLNLIAGMVEKQLNSQKADYNFYHGFTSWVNINNEAPYFAYCDASFETYVRLYNNRNEFSAADLRRIYDKEKLFLEKARIVFFHSQWALEETKKAYNMKGQNFRSAGVGGFIDKIPDTDQYAGGRNILFISRLFQAKGGYDCFNALKRINQKHPEITLTIIGELPPKEVLDYPQVKYEGFLRKSKPEEFVRYKELLQSAWLLMHPTTRDVNPLVLAEAGYYGTPSIATRSFAIPELVRDGETGFLIDAPVKVDDIVAILQNLLNDEQRYLAARKAVKNFTTNTLSWNKVGDYIYSQIEK